MMSGFGTTTWRSKRPGTQQRRIENVRTVGRRDQDDALVRLEAVHLDQQLVQRLLALVIATAETGAAMTADRVDFVDEDDAGRVLLGLLEHVADTACADADEHLHEVRTRDGEERHVGFAGDGTRRERLAGTGRTDQQHAARDLAAEALELLRIAQELDDLFEVLLGLVHAGDVGKGHAAMRLGQKLGLGLAEAHCAAGATLHLAHEEDPDAEDEQHRQEGSEIAQETGGAVALRPRHDGDVLRLEALHQRVVDHRRIGLEASAVLDIGPHDAIARHDNLANATALYITEELRVRDLPRARL
jgi:hypothetical protein